MDAIRIGVIGAGGNSRGHGKRLKALDGVTISAVTDPSQQALNAYANAVFSDEDPVPTYSDYREMLDEEKLDAVIISSPHTLHFEQIMGALDKGLHVLTEKPMVCTVDEGLELVEKVKHAKKHVVVSYQRRLMARYRFMKQFIHSPDFGRPFYISAFLSQEWLQSQSGTWRQKKSLSGGGELHDSGSHIIDMITWLLDDDAATVTALTDNRNTEVDIDSAVSFRMKNGALGTLAVVGSGPGGFFWEDMTITGENGYSLFLRNGRLTTVMGHNKEVMSVEKFGADISPDAHFIDVIRGQADNASPPEDFLRVIRFTQAAWQSADNGGVAVTVG